MLRHMSHFVAEPHVGYALKRQPMSAEEFLAWDETQNQERYEFVRGEVFMMTGGVDRHFTVAGNLFVTLRQQLRGTTCRVYMNDVKLRVEAADCYFYPDLMVTCSAADATHRKIKREPLLVVEVLSPSTAAFDRGDKFATYRQLQSLQEYLLLSQDRTEAELHRRAEGWRAQILTAGEVRLQCLDAAVPLATIYEDVPLD